MDKQSFKGIMAPSSPVAPPTEEDIDDVKSAVLAKLALSVGKDPASATDRDWFVATALAMRDRIVHQWLAVDRASRAKGQKRVYYLSLEFLIGRLFADVLCNLGLAEVFHAALGDLGLLNLPA
jgi:starch phosphorylase